ncbi:beta-galactosidase [Bacteroidia bacterium]|nr:beta-galactosidase [Bacteroidia bacterium]GHT47692.1 beta-galactosidase [Bacteroidia bacterium]
MIRLIFILLLSLFVQIAGATDIPHLEKKGNATQLIVNGKPFIMLAGEIHNSSSSTLEYMQTVWPKLRNFHVNTVLMAVTWEQFEPVEGKFDYSLVDGLIQQARENDIKIVFLWFASWKNGLSGYAPEWVKKNTKRFPLSKDSNGKSKDVLTPMSNITRDADAKAFATLMKHIKEVDSNEQTVIMVQIENEVGIKSQPRDMSETATKAYNSSVPKELMDYLTKNRENLHPEILRRWEKGNFRTNGTWPEVFGGFWEADEIFSAWHYAKYVQAVAEAGKKEYPIPVFVNAWLPDPNGQPHTWPSGGPVPNVLDVWRAGAPDIDALSPDIYQPEFKWLCEEYTRNGNPLLIPEAHREADAPARAYWAIGKHNAICFAPFGIESMPDDHPIKDAYALLEQAIPLITDAQGTGKMTAVYWQNKEKEPGQVVVPLGNWNLHVRYSENGLPKGTRPGAIIIQKAEDEFYLIGQGVEIGFKPMSSKVSQNVDILTSEIGRFEDGVFIRELQLNGDEIRAHDTSFYRTRIPVNVRNTFLDPSKPRILRVRIFSYE